MGPYKITVKSNKKYTVLDKAYRKLINDVLNVSEENKERWEYYNIIIDELIKNEKEEYFQELKYRLTDGENPNKVILDIINRDKELSNLMWFLVKRIEEYLEEDFYNRFIE